MAQGAPLHVGCAAAVDVVGVRVFGRARCTRSQVRWRVRPVACSSAITAMDPACPRRQAVQKGWKGDRWLTQQEDGAAGRQGGGGARHLQLRAHKAVRLDGNSGPRR